MAWMLAQELAQGAGGPCWARHSILRVARGLGEGGTSEQLIYTNPREGIVSPHYLWIVYLQICQLTRIYL